MLRIVGGKVTNETDAKRRNMQFDARREEEEKRKKRERQDQTRYDGYSAMATTAAPPIMARNSRCKFAVVPAESVCNPGVAELAVAAGWTTVTAVTVFRSPLAMVVVLGKADVKGVLFSVVDELDELVVDEAVVDEGEEAEEEEEAAEEEVEVDDVVEDAAVEVASELDATVDEVASVEDADVDVGAAEEVSSVLLLPPAAAEEEEEVGWSEVGWSEVG